MTTTYIAGPMTGIPLHNHPAFEKAKRSLEMCGHVVVSPADMDKGFGINADTPMSEVAPKMPQIIRADIEAVLTADAMYMLAGWERSTGARAEHAIAVWRGIPIWYEAGAAQ